MAWMFRVAEYNACTEAEAQEVVAALNKYNVGGGVRRLYVQDFSSQVPGTSYSEPDGEHEYLVDFRNGAKGQNVANMRASLWWKAGVLSWWASALKDEVSAAVR